MLEKLKELIKSILKFICDPEKVLFFINSVSEKMSVSFNDKEIIDELESEMAFINCYIRDKSVN